jgi:outer membrane protein assembly factor BamD
VNKRLQFRHLARVGLVLPAVLLAACGGSSSDTAKPAADQPPEALYSQAQQAFDERDFKTATTRFDEVERQHPYSTWATKAQLMSAYASYQRGDYDGAIVALDRFISLHPGSEELAYAYYLKALCYYDRISDVERDQRITQLATNALNDVITRFPTSDYARDAKLKLDLTYDQLAGKDMAIGRFYLKRGEYNAAINRFRSVVKTWQTTSQVPEALERLVEAYVALGLKEEARHVAAVLGHNYPGDPWYQDAYALLTGSGIRPPDDKDFFDRTLGSIF